MYIGTVFFVSSPPKMSGSSYFLCHSSVSTLNIFQKTAIVMSRVSIIIVSYILLFSTINTYAQESESNPLKEAPISEQFDYTIEKSNRYEQFRVVRITWLNQLKSNVGDTLSNLHKQLVTNRNQINKHQQRIDSLNTRIENLNTRLEKAIGEKNSLSFLGAQISKSGYQSVMWGLVIVLAAGLAIFVMLFKRSHIVTNQTKTTYADLQKEFDDHRKRALEREKVMARNHLNELNKLRGQ